MIPEATRASIDASIDGAFDRLDARAAQQGDATQALIEAARSAAAGGKRFRPRLVAASFAAFRETADDAPPALFEVAAAFELLHTAFVIHDDVIDRDVTRRGIPNVAGRFRERGLGRGADAAGAALLGDAAAILAGDLLLHEAIRMIALADTTPAHRAALLALLDDAVFVSAAGELADVENAVSGELAPARDILSATFDKTAVYSFTAPLTAGAILADASTADLDALTRLGGSLGLAFQLVDDLIGAFGTAEQAGKDVGSDLRESKRTPLIALARDSDQWPLVTSTLALAHTGPIAVRRAQEALESSGARARLRGVIDATLEDVRAGARRAGLPAAAAALIDDLADAVAERIP